MYGAVQETYQAKPAVIASYGFVVLALDYFSHSHKDADLIMTLNLEYFEKAVHFLLNHPRVEGKHGVALKTISTGTAAAFAMLAADIKGINSLVALNGPIYDGPIHFKYKNKFITDDIAPMVGENTYNYFYTPKSPFDDGAQACLIPFHLNSRHVPILYLASMDDQSNPVPLYADHIEKLFKSSKRNNIRVIRYKEAGHILEMPYTPMCPMAWFPLKNSNESFGGKPKSHSDAQIKAWSEAITFITYHLKHELKSNL